MTVSVEEIDSLLPQTQCGECGYPGCRPYAEALAQDLTTIDLCPPGGVKGLQALGKLLKQDPGPYVDKMREKTRPPQLADIRESECIGCTKCIQACPVDAIIGSSKSMHAVIQHECTGCGLCVAPCPVDCIDLLPITETPYDPTIAKQRFEAKQIRRLRDALEEEKHYREKRLLAHDALTQETQAKQQYIQEALARVMAKKR